MIESASYFAFHVESAVDFREYLRRNGFVRLDAFFNTHLQAAEHDGNQSTSGGPPNHIEVVARLWRILYIDGLHQLFENVERR